MHLPPDEQRSEKQDQVRELFLGNWEQSWFNPDCINWFPTRSADGYRNRVRLRIMESGVLGFFNSDKSVECAVLEPALKTVLSELKRRSAECRAELKAFSYAELRTPDLQGRPALYLGGPSPGERSDCRRLQRVFEDHLLAMEGLTPDEQWPLGKYRITDEVYQCVPVGGFMQVNSLINAALVGEVCRRAVGSGVERVVDLFCGSGNFLLPLSAAGVAGWGVELSQRSVQGATLAAREQSLPAQFMAMDADSWCSEAVLHKSPPDLLVLDPPRAGLKDVAPVLASWQVPQVAYCSCNPRSLLRDLRIFVEHGYTITDLVLFDMFAHTDHVEILAWLRG
jgi:23S rRNA (uracil1939-C5)-methyltransferase